nr:hypothetical protein [Tanacetum cinerariifolium]
MFVAQEVREGVADEEHNEGVPAGDVAKGDVRAAHDEVPTTDEEPSILSPTPPTPPHNHLKISLLLPKHTQHHHNYLRRVEHLELDKIAQALEITKLKRKVKKLERENKVKVLKLRRLQKVGTAQRIDTSDETVMDDVSNQGRLIADMDADADVVLEEAKEVAEDAKDGHSADIQGRMTESQAKIYKIDLDHANKVLSLQKDETKRAKVQEIAEVVTTTKLITKVVTAASKTITA